MTSGTRPRATSEARKMRGAAQEVHPSPLTPLAESPWSGLQHDHASLEGHLAGVLESNAGEDRDQLTSRFDAFTRDFEAHLDHEEAVILPFLLVRTRRDAQTILAEHRHLRRRCRALAEDIAGDRARTRSIQSFLHELRAHGACEDEIYRRARTDAGGSEPPESPRFTDQPSSEARPAPPRARRP